MNVSLRDFTTYRNAYTESLKRSHTLQDELKFELHFCYRTVNLVHELGGERLGYGAKVLYGSTASKRHVFTCSGKIQLNITSVGPHDSEGVYSALEYNPVVAWVLFKQGTFSGKTHPTWLMSAARRIKRCITCYDWFGLLGGVRLPS